MTNADLSDYRVYDHFYDGVDLLQPKGTDQERINWLLESRKAANIKQWLRQDLINRGYPESKVDGVLMYNEGGGAASQWLLRVQDMVSEETK